MFLKYVGIPFGEEYECDNDDPINKICLTGFTVRVRMSRGEGMTQKTKKEMAMGSMVKMAVAGITMDPKTNMPIIILKSEDDKIAIPIWIGIIEASAIATELEGIALARPMTHDLLKNVIDAMGGTLIRIEVNDLRENTYYASLFIDQGDSIIEVDSRPSDAIAIALRAGADIYVAEKVIENTHTVDKNLINEIVKLSNEKSDDKKDKDKWTEILENLRPEDFGKYKM
jgi:bifunctional DNase/RNase